MKFTNIANWGLFSCLFGAILLLGNSPLAGAAKSEVQVSALVLKVEGKGAAQVRRKSGVTSSLGINQEIFAGDKITTDKDSLVELGLVDGTLIKIGTNSEYIFSSGQPQKGFLSHIFQLTKGSVRALIEKRTEKKTVKFRINTPSGTMGVRGTEILITHSDKDETTKLFLLEGVAGFGNPNCDKEKICISVTGGNWSQIKKGQKHPSPPRPFTGQDLLAETTDAAGVKQKDTSLLQLLGIKNEASEMDKIQAKELAALINDASLRMQVAQNDLLNRDEELRKAMEQAIADGTFDQYMRLAERFDDIKNGKKKTRTSESFSAIAKTRKFALASAILKTGKVSLSSSSSKGPATSTSTGTNLKTSSGSDITSIESAEGVGSVQGKIEEANAIAEKLNLAVTAGGGGSAADQLTAQVVAQLSGDQVVAQSYKEYYNTYTYYDQCEWWQLLCGDEKYNGHWYEEESENSLMKENTTVVKSSGTCYETKKTCGKILQPCDLSSGKFCTPTWKDECTETKVVVKCPQ